MSLETNFNASPFYDDFDEEKNFHRVLFRPAVPVQARELTQLQTILQNQVERFGDNIYKQGTVIKGCNFTYDYNYQYIKIRDLQVDGQNVTLPNYMGLYATDTTSNLNAVVVNYVTGLETQDPETNILYIKYLNTGDSEKKTFANNETITLFNSDYRLDDVLITVSGTGYSNTEYLTFTGGGGSGAAANLVTYSNGSIRSIIISNFGSGYVTAPTVAIVNSTGGATVSGSGAGLTAINYYAQITVCDSTFSANSTTPVGTGTAATIGDGIIYQKGHFVRVEEQTVILDKYTTSPNNVVVGFYTQESIVNSYFDSTLLDNAQGYSNYTAPGAHRLKLTPTLQVLTTQAASGNSEFFKLVEFENGRVIKLKTETEFNSVDKKLALRTSEESGDYVVSPFTISTEDITGNTTHLNAVVSSGIGYVDGTRVELNDSVRIAIRQGTDTNTSINQSISTNYGNYVLVDQILGVFDFTAAASVNLRNTAATDNSDNFGGGPSSPGSVIGTSKIRSLVYDSGVPGSPTARYRLYLFDIVMSPGNTFKDVRSIQATGVVADTVLENSVSVLKDTDYDTLSFTSGYASVKSVANVDFIYRTVTANTFTTSGNVNIQVTGTYDYFPYTPASTLNSIQEQDFIVVPTANATGATALSGTVATTGNVVTGTGTEFAGQLQVGDHIKFQANDTFFKVTAITNTTSMTVNSVGPQSLTGNTLFLAFPKNIPIRLDRETANVAIDATGKFASIYVGNTISGTTDVKVFHNVKVSPGVNTVYKAKTVTKQVYVKLSTDRLSTTTIGPWCLGIPDAYKLNAVYVGTSNTYSNTTTNYASSFELVTGQSDNAYGLSYLRYKPGSILSLSATSCLLVSVDLFTHSAGYFLAAPSYPIDDSTVSLPANKIRTSDIPTFRSPKTGRLYNIRSIVDFRPIVAPTANVAATTVASATVDPVTTETLTGTLYFPTPNEIFEGDVEYYMPRADRIVIDKNNNINVIEGVPGISPVPPRPYDKTMSLATVLVPSYPSLSPQLAFESLRPDYATFVVTDQVKRYTMKDIKRIEQRIQSLEYYSLLNTLEKNTKDLIIPSEANSAVSRFKNGFFVDPLNSYDIANVNDLEFNITIDTAKSVARPPLDQNVINLKANTSLSSGYAIKGDLALLNYAQAVALEQPLATRFRNLAGLAWSYDGRARLFPEYDNYYDTTRDAVKFTIDLSAPLDGLVKSINDSVVFKKDSKTVTTTQSDWVNANEKWGFTWGAGLVDIEEQTTKTITNTSKSSITAGKTTQSEQQIGDFLTDFDFNPFVREQEVYFVVTGLRPGARHYVFFDKKTIDARPGEVADLASIVSSESLSKNDTFKFTGSKSANLVANSTGGLAGCIFIPGNTFNVGQKEVLIADVDSISSLDTSVSKAMVYFNAYNFNKQIKSLTMVTKAPSSFQTTEKVTRTVNTAVVSRVSVHTVDPLAQTFNINFNEGTDGVFLTKVDLYFRSKDPSSGITVQIRETDNGYPAPAILAQKQISSSGAQTSNVGSVATTVTFDTPIFVRNNKDYCITLIPDGNSPNWLAWTSVPGQPDVDTNQVDNGDFGAGVLFVSSNDKVWTPIQNEDLKFTIYYANFTSHTANIVLENEPYEFLTLTGVEGSFQGGERVAQKASAYIANSAVFTGNTSSSVLSTSTSLTSNVSVGDYLLMVNANNITTSLTGTVTANGTHTNVSGSGTSFSTQLTVGDYIYINNNIREVRSISNTTHMNLDAPLQSNVAANLFYGVTESFQVSKVLSVNSTSISLKDNLEKNINNTTAWVGVQRVVSAVVDKVDTNDTVVLRDSNAANTTFLFAATGRLVGSTSDAVASISSVDDFTVNYCEPHISTIVPLPATISLTQTIAGTTAASQSQPINFGVSNKTIYEAEIRSRSNEILSYSGAKSLQVSVGLSKPSTVSKISPVVDLIPASMVVLQNKINNLYDNETTRYGNAKVKYISKKVVLADGLDAEDLKVYLTSYRPSGTDVKVYCKVLSNDDNESFDTKEWSVMNLETTSNLFSDSANEDDYLEYEYSIARTPTSTKLAGLVKTNSNTTLTGSGTTFTSSLVANDIIKIVNSSTTTDYEINVVDSVTNNTSLVLKTAIGPYSDTGTSGLSIEKVTQPKATFKYADDGNFARYYDASLSAHTSFKIFAIKVVLLSTSTQNVPTVKDIRALAVSV
jgi:hypothetical protein